jgi:glycosyltransferase involved in cell wall biosynthesis
MSGQPIVSILINNFNYERFLPDAIDAALTQTYSDVEVIVVDDGSSDQSRQVIESYGDRIHSIFKPNGGQSSAFNAGFAASKGEIICFLDADDYCITEKAEKLVEKFAQYPEAQWLFHRLQRVATDGDHLPSTMADFVESIIDVGNLISEGKSINTPAPATSGLCFRRSLLTQMLPMPEQLRISADNYLRLSSMYLAPGIVVPEKLAFHRIHGSNSYESNKNMSYLHAETNIQTAYYLRQRFPKTNAFTERLFSHSLGQLVGRRELEKATKLAEFDNYLQEYFPLQAWIRHGPRILGNIVKSAINA